jgi:hypothetical protein
MKENDVILCPVHSISNTLKPILSKAPQDLLFEIVTINDRNFLRYVLHRTDLHLHYAQIHLKFRFLCTGLSVRTVGHFWVDDVLLNESLQPIWKQANVIKLETDKEIDPSGPRLLTPQEFVSAEDFTAWISISYSRVFIYHDIGLFLLRNSLPGAYFYADVLLNFFKIVELVTYKRIQEKPKLKTILQESKKLKIASLDESEIRDFYTIRCRDSAHDWDKVQPITRRQAIECKMWSEELIISDMVDRLKKPHPPGILKVHDSPKGAIIEIHFQ